MNALFASYCRRENILKIIIFRLHLAGYVLYFK